MMRALDSEVVDAVFAAVEGLVPRRRVFHPLGRHRRRVPDRLCFEGILIRLVTGCSWEDTERLLGYRVSDTTLRSRRDEWVAAGVFDQLFDEAVAGYDKIVGLDLTEVCIDGAQAKARCGGEGTGRNPADRGKTGWKWSVAVEAAGIPVGWVAAPANRHDSKLLAPTLAVLENQGLVDDIETLHLDKGYDYRFIDELIAEVGIDDANIARKKKPHQPQPVKRPYRIDIRWVVERTNAWFEAFGQLRRNTDRKSIHRVAQLALAAVMLITARLIDWRNRYSPQPCPIR